jgi:RNA recognition motif. (a.k.a. RRM, RBD, or RNP domain)
VDELGPANWVCKGVTLPHSARISFSSSNGSFLFCASFQDLSDVRIAVQGYALIEYRTRDEAEAAIQSLDGSKFLDRTIRVSWAFVKPPTRGGGRRR